MCHMQVPKKLNVFIFLLNFCRETIYHYSNLAQLCIFFFITEYLLCIVVVCLCVQENYKKKDSNCKLPLLEPCSISCIFFFSFLPPPSLFAYILYAFVGVYLCVKENHKKKNSNCKSYFTTTQVLLNFVYFSVDSFFSSLSIYMYKHFLGGHYESNFIFINYLQESSIIVKQHLIICFFIFCTMYLLFKLPVD